MKGRLVAGPPVDDLRYIVKLVSTHVWLIARSTDFNDG